MQPKKPTKRGRPTKKNSDDGGSGESFEHKPKKRAPSKKNLEDKKKVNKITTKPPKSKVELVSSIESFSNSDAMSDENQQKIVKIAVETFNSDLVFAEILNKANKEPEFLINLKNLLSGYCRIQQDKKTQYRKKWKLLRNSNCTQDEYLSRQSELKRMEAEEFNEFEEDIISKLAISHIKGFETKQSILESGKINLGKLEDGVEYVIDEKSWNSYRSEQKKLLEILMKENDFVSQDYKLVNMSMNYPSAPAPNSSIKEEENEMEMKFNNIETEENPEHTQFLFCKHYNNVNYDKVFDSSSPFKVSEDDKYYIDPKAMAWLLESKCDEIYTNDAFQKQTYNHYTRMLRELYQKPQAPTDKEVMDDLLEVGAYVLNSVHYYQKFKLKCDLLHPLDLMLVIDKLSKERSVKMPGSSKMEEEPVEIKINDMLDERDEINY